MLKEITLIKGRERSLLRHHPWIFSGAIDQVRGNPSAGETVDVLSSNGTWLAKAAYSPASQIRARVWSFDKNEPIDHAFFMRRIQKAASRKEKLGIPQWTNSWRIVHGEADGLPGCVIDRYGDYCVCQFLSAGIEHQREKIIHALRTMGFKGIYERSDTDARTRDGLEAQCGPIEGEEPPQLFQVVENNISYLVDIRNGHKTGFYLDQRDNRASMPFVKGNDVLNCFCYTGGFGLRAAKDGAKHVTQVDLSEAALEIAVQNAKLNNFTEDTFTYIKADVFGQLRKFRDMGQSFDTVILDPPKFADTQKQLEGACRGYKDINLLAAKLIRPGGTLLTFSCSGAMTPELFQKIVGDAARDAGRDAISVKTLSQAPDHSISLNFQEGRYLTGLQVYLP